MAEHSIEDDIIGIALDGTGFGEDGAIWGGEVMICNINSFKRVAHLEYLPMPGGEKAILEPWRMAVSYLYQYLSEGMEIAHYLFADQTEQLNIVFQAIEKKINAPETSSCGRLFDAVSAILGVRNKVAYEGQAAIMLESLAMKTTQDVPKIGKFEITKKKEYSHIADKIRSQTRVNQIALSGGCFQNMLLLKGLTNALKNNDFQVLTNREVPVNDGGISLGQAYWGMNNV
jgi:hydrogenase maturation protein HypF